MTATIVGWSFISDDGAADYEDIAGTFYFNLSDGTMLTFHKSDEEWSKDATDQELSDFRPISGGKVVYWDMLDVAVPISHLVEKYPPKKIDNTEDNDIVLS